MNYMMGRPLVVFAFSFVAMWLFTWFGASLRERRPVRGEETHADLDIALSACLTLLSLIIGFNFSMAVSRYDHRKNCEEAEANAIGTEYVRADLLPAADAIRVRALLKRYIDQRILFYKTLDQSKLREIDAVTAQLRADLWSAVMPAIAAQPTPFSALAISGMNDVLNSQGSTQAAWWNRMPVAAWGLMMAIAIYCNLLIGYAARRIESKAVLFLVVPLAVSIAFFLIADIDTPRGGIIRVSPQNLTSLSQSLNANYPPPARPCTRAPLWRTLPRLERPIVHGGAAISKRD